VLQRIGGFPTDALTEDYLVTLKTKKRLDFAPSL
jgi:hypothetical protein